MADGLCHQQSFCSKKFSVQKGCRNLRLFPPNYNEILLDVRRPGKPVILEGQSGTGKTTCVRHIISELNDELKTRYLTARNAAHISSVETVVRKRKPGRYVIDDFHRLSMTRQSFQQS
jgi:ABC-type ATPase with predicted acetyltransferase domain